MSAESVRVESDSKERVAYDLMKYVISNGQRIGDKDDILKLYVECLGAVWGRLDPLE